MKRLVEMFKAAWHSADKQGREGERVEAGLDAVLPVVLHQYSEWLDGEGLVVGDADSADDRSHDDLVRDFLNSEVVA